MNSSRLDLALDEFLDAWLDGNSPDIGEFVSRYPECATQLRRLLPMYQSVEACFQDRRRDGAREAVDSKKPLPRLLGDFMLLRKLGQGGMGVVYEAEQLSLVRTVAVKVLPRDLMDRPKAVERFRREARAVASLSHPGIVDIYCIEEEHGSHFFAMEYVKGGSLANWTAKTGEQVREACRLVIQVAEALHHAHNHHILHRDVKPANILVRRDGNAVLSDFGISRLEELPPLTSTGFLPGTADYLSPEQLVGPHSDLDRRIDIYALGVTLYELLTSKRPFTADTTPGTMWNILHRDVTPPSSLNSTVPRELEKVCLKAIEKDRQRRYASSAELAADLRRFLHDQPVLAKAAGPLRRLRGWCRRRQRRVAVTLFLALAATAVFAFQWQGADARALQARTSTQARSEELSRAALETLESDPAEALLLGREAVRHQSNPAAMRAAAAAFLAMLEPGRELRTFLGHAGAVNCGSFSDDGALVATGGGDGTARIWNPVNGEELARLPHPSPITDVAFHPDGRRLATSCADGKARVWNLGTQSILYSVPGYTGPIRNFLTGTQISFSPDGHHLLVAGGLRLTADIFNADDGRHELRFGGPGCHVTLVTSAEFSPNGEFVVTGARGLNVRVWDARTGEERNYLHGFPDVVHYATFGRGGRTVLALGSPSAIQVHEALGQGVLAAHSAAGLNPRSARFDQDYGLLLVLEGTIQSGASGVGSFPLPDLGPEIEAFRSGTCAVCLPDGRIVLWDFQTRERLTTLRGHRRKAMFLTSDPTGSRLLSGSEDGTARLWDAGRSWHPDFFRQVADAPITSLDASPDGTALLAGSADGIVRAIGNGGTLLAEWIVGEQALGTSFFAGGRRAAVVLSDRLLAFALPGGELLEEIPGEAHATPRMGPWTASAHGGRLTFWSGELGSPPSVLAEETGASFFGLAASEGGRFLAALATDTTVHLWKMPEGRPLPFPARTGRGTKGLAFGPDSRTLFLFSVDLVESWSLKGRIRAVSPNLRLGSIHSWAVDPVHGLVFLAGGRDGRVWDTRHSSWTRPFQVGGFSNAEVASSPDGRFFYALSPPGPVKILLAETAETVATLDIPGLLPTSATFGTGGKTIHVGWDDGSVLEFPLDPERIAADILPRKFTPSKEEEFRHATVDDGSAVGKVINFYQLNNNAWSLCRSRKVPLDSALKAVRLSRIVCGQFPDVPAYLNTLGVALYRAGEVEAALERLLQAEECQRRATGRAEPANTVFIALALLGCGRSEEAAKTWARVLGEEKTWPWREDERRDYDSFKLEYTDRRAGLDEGMKE